MGNESVDNEAKQTAIADEVPLFTGFLFSWAKLHIKREMMDNWNQWYLSLSTVKITKR